MHLSSIDEEMQTHGLSTLNSDNKAPSPMPRSADNSRCNSKYIEPTISYCLLSPRTNYPIHGKTLSLDRFNMHQFLLHAESSVAPRFEPVKRRPQIRD
ncbi:hypothetical protein TNCV_4121371 [Trichonephila clavipes]|nr:hypothetical protein TNCV_4121371 [Trichonephila clavipes]